MKIINIRILCAVAILGLLGSMACKKKDTSPPDPGPDDQVLRAIHRNGVLSDSFYYNKRQQVTHYKHFNIAGEIEMHSDMTYDNAGQLISTSSYLRNDLIAKDQITTTANQMSVVGNMYIPGSTVSRSYTTILKFDNAGRLISMLDSMHFSRDFNGISYIGWVDISNRKYDNDKMILFETELISKRYDPTTPNIDTIISDVFTTRRFEYGDTPNKLYSLGKKNPYLLVVLTQSFNPFYAGSTNVTKTTIGNSTSVFQDIDFTSGFYVRTRKETTTTNGLTSTTNWQFYYSPVSGL